MKAHFVTFMSPGTFVCETTEKPIDSWDVPTAVKMAKTITERYGATPFGFTFSTRERKETDLDSKVVNQSGIYYLPHCKIETLEEIKARNDPRESILVSNMEFNNYSKVVVTTAGWKACYRLNEGDIVLKADLT